MIDAQWILGSLLHLLPVLYGIAFFDYLLVFLTEDKTVRRLARPLLFAAVGLNLLFLLGYTVYFEHVPLVSVYQVFGAIGFSLAVTYLWVESRTETPYTGPFILFLVMVFQIVNAEAPSLEPDFDRVLESPIFGFHVSSAVLGYSAFAAAAVYGLLYLLLYRQMRGKRFGLVFRRLPSLDILERMNFYASVVGVTFLGLGIILGAVWGIREAQREYSPYGLDRPDAKVITAIATFVIYGLNVLGRRFRGWRGKQLAYTSLFGFILVLFSVLGVNFFFPTFHRFLG